jgi:hypothetical protein
MSGDAVMTTVLLAQAQWPDGTTGGAADELPAVAGFIESAFSPLAAAVAETCLTGLFGPPPTASAQGERTAIVLASATGDLATAAAVASAVQAGRRVPPLLFYQSNPNAVAGYIAARWGLYGPVLCTIPGSAYGTATDGDASSRALTEARASATALIDDGDADAALVIAVNAYLSGTAEGIAQLIGPASWARPEIAPAKG